MLFNLYERIEMRDIWMKEFPCVSEEEIKGIALMHRDLNPIHHEDAEAKKEELNGIVATAVQIVGYISSAVADEVPRVIALEFEKLRMVNPLYAGSHPIVYCTVNKKNRKLAHITVMVKNGFDIIAEGTCLLLLPKQEKVQAAA